MPLIPLLRVAAFAAVARPRCHVMLRSLRGLATTAPAEVHRSVLTPVRFLERSAAVFPEKVAVVYGDKRFTYAQFGSRVNQFAAALLKAGVGPGDKVAMLCPNTPPMLEAHYAVPLIGAVVVPLNTRIPANEVSYIVNHSDAKVLVVDSELVPVVVPKDLPQVKQFVVINDEYHTGPRGQLPGGVDYEEFLRSSGDGSAAVAMAIPDENGVISLNYTSGTTGNPKGVMLHHRGAYLNALGELLHSGVNGKSKVVWTLPMFHCNGWCYTWAITAIAGTHLCLRKVEYPEIMRLLQEENATHMCAAPIVVSGLSSHAVGLTKAGKALPAALKGLRVVTAGAPPAAKVIEDLESFGVDVLHVYGLTECYGPHTLCEWKDEWKDLSPKDKAAKKARQGVPYITSHDAQVMDRSMKPVPRDATTVGEICLKGHNVMLGYYKNPKATAEAFEGGWFHTGDMGVVHPDGYIEIVDRSKDIIISGGENISSVQVESALMQCPKVAEAAVIAIPDPKWGEVPKAFVVVKPGQTLSADEITAHCRTLLSGFKIPKQFEFPPELPHTATGKIQKNVLRDKEWAGRSRKVN